MAVKITVAENYYELSNLAAHKVAQVIRSRPDTVLGLPTGSTPLGMYQELISIPVSYTHLKANRARLGNLAVVVLSPLSPVSYTHL